MKKLNGTHYFSNNREISMWNNDAVMIGMCISILSTMPCQTLSHSHDIAPALSSGSCVPVVSLKITAKYAIKMFSINKE